MAATGDPKHMRVASSCGMEWQGLQPPSWPHHIRAMPLTSTSHIILFVSIVGKPPHLTFGPHASCPLLVPVQPPRPTACPLLREDGEDGDPLRDCAAGHSTCETDPCGWSRHSLPEDLLRMRSWIRDTCTRIQIPHAPYAVRIADPIFCRSHMVQITHGSDPMASYGEERRSRLPLLAWLHSHPPNAHRNQSRPRAKQGPNRQQGRG